MNIAVYSLSLLLVFLGYFSIWHVWYVTNLLGWKNSVCKLIVWQPLYKISNWCKMCLTLHYALRVVLEWLTTCLCWQVYPGKIEAVDCRAPFDPDIKSPLRPKVMFDIKVHDGKAAVMCHSDWDNGSHSGNLMVSSEFPPPPPPTPPHSYLCTLQKFTLLTYHFIYHFVIFTDRRNWRGESTSVSFEVRQLVKSWNTIRQGRGLLKKKLIHSSLLSFPCSFVLFSFVSSVPSLPFVYKILISLSRV